MSTLLNDFGDDIGPVFVTHDFIESVDLSLGHLIHLFADQLHIRACKGDTPECYE